MRKRSMEKAFFLLCALVSLFSYGANETCDDGEYKVESDLGGEDNWVCASDKPFLNTAFYTPASFPDTCLSAHEEVDSKHVCMEESISYKGSPPSYGSYRLLAPKYGDYRYLPPQRWLHTLKTGGVAFLYHPCADPDQIDSLKALARSCLEMYVITPYKNLTKEKPLAVVTWGCVLRLSWVRDEEVKHWLTGRGVHYQATLANQDLVYHKGWRSYDTTSMTSLCEGIKDLDEHDSSSSSKPSASDIDTSDPSPDHSDTSDPSEHDPGQHNTSDSPEHDQDAKANSKECSSNRTRSSSEGGACIDHTLKTLQSHRTGLAVLLAMLGVILLGFIVLFVVKVGSAWSRRRPKNQRYKSVSKYFPFSYEKQNSEVIIPAVGMPKAGATERQVLLNDSDEDEL